MTNVKCKTLRLVVLSIALHTLSNEHIEASSISQQQHQHSSVKHSVATSGAVKQQQQQQTLAQLIASTGQNNSSTIQQNDEAQNVAINQLNGGTKNRLQQESSSKKRSESNGEEDQLPLATINNHSNRNNNNNIDQVTQLRPPQYVDVSALVGRNASISSSASSYSTSNGNSLLTPKSRSGLPECATQQVCNAIFVRMNYTQRLCECSSNYNWKCSNNLDPQDGHTIELTRKFDKRIYTQIKTCEPLREVRACKSPTDWTLLALQSERSGKAHYVVVCKCPTWAQLEGPYTHNHPPYANIPGIRVYGMLCAHQTARSSSAQTYASYNPALSIYPEFPWSEALNVLNTTNLTSALDSH